MNSRVKTGFVQWREYLPSPNCLVASPMLLNDLAIFGINAKVIEVYY